jgi:hypothetical protein
MRSPLASPGSGPQVSGSGAVCIPPSRREMPDIPLPIHITLRPGPVRCRLDLWQPAPVSR